MRGERQTRESEPARPRFADRKTPVITDDGGEVALALLEVGQPTTAGETFVHRGRRWVISGRRQDSRVLVARPATEPGRA
ncbi:MAG: hypothetical protein MUC56_03970 [Thermoanaerobaculales bacterium]|jgi:hypothetical protein|nr:hypothetical protein [Thermoanaerobaculales bacterium]